MKKFKKITVVILTTIAIAWIALTFYVEIESGKQHSEFGNAAATSKALIVYDADPFYNLDEQVCNAFAKSLAAKGWFVEVATVSEAKQLSKTKFKLFVFCANTYNWSPDWAIRSFINNDIDIKNKNIVAITLGAGSTSRSKKVFEDVIRNRGGIVIGSQTYWLWKPNDESEIGESNVKIATEHAANFGNEIAGKF